jgi:hypothetical protein
MCLTENEAYIVKHNLCEIMTRGPTQRVQNRRSLLSKRSISCGLRGDIEYSIYDWFTEAKDRHLRRIDFSFGKSAKLYEI